MQTKGEIEKAVELIFSLAPYARIIHHIPGRIRIRIGSNAAALLPKEGLDSLGAVSRLPGIENIRVKPMIGSILVEYDREVFEPGLWERIIGRNCGDNERKRLQRELIDRISAVLGV